MTARRHQDNGADRNPPASIHAAYIWSVVAPCRLASVIGWEFVLGRVLAHSCVEERVGEGDDQATTERGRDKRPQCAARSVGCYCFIFLLTQQCAAAAHNVRLTINALWGLDVSHIAEVGNG